MQANQTYLRALKLDHDAIHDLLLPPLTLVPCEPWESCPVMHTKSKFEIFMPKKRPIPVATIAKIETGLVWPYAPSNLVWAFHPVVG